MACLWIKSSPSLNNGILAINQLDDSRFEQFVRRIISKMKLKESEIFSADEVQKLVKIFSVNESSLLLAIKTLVYIYKRLLKYIFLPMELKNDLKSLGIRDKKAECIIKLWSNETRLTLDELETDKTNQSLDFMWTLNAELSSDYCKKTKVPKAYLTLLQDNKETEIEVTHPEMYSMFLQFEAIQNELDNLGL